MSNEKNDKQQKVEIQVATGSGNYPESGYEDYNVHQKLSAILHQAQIHLHLQDTSNWIAREGDRVLNPSLSLAENNLFGRVRIVWAPTESGGGACTRR
jgi:hypothetical protein